MGYTSEQHDATGLIYLRFRYFDASVGQFISVDPLVGSTLDPYGYASGNPLQMSDPLGLWSFLGMSDDTWGTIGTVVGAVGAAAGLAVLVAATGGLALPAIVGATATYAGVAGLGISGVIAGNECMRDGFGSECGWAIAGVGLSKFGVSKAAKGIESKALSKIPDSLDRRSYRYARHDRGRARLHHALIGTSGVGFDVLNNYCN